MRPMTVRTSTANRGAARRRHRSFIAAPVAKKTAIALSVVEHEVQATAVTEKVIKAA